MIGIGYKMTECDSTLDVVIWVISVDFLRFAFTGLTIYCFIGLMFDDLASSARQSKPLSPTPVQTSVRKYARRVH